MTDHLNAHLARVEAEIGRTDSNSPVSSTHATSRGAALVLGLTTAALAAVSA